MEYQIGELLCGVIPVFILCLQIVPSLRLLYYYGLMCIFSDLNLKVIGHQWYWRYEYSDFDNVVFDSYIKRDDILCLGDLRLLEVDNRCVLPVDINIRFCVSSLDVIHSWTVFNFFIKLDAIRGILRVFFFNFPMIGIFFGQCSEICGANHSFMPVVLEVTLFDHYKNWCLAFSFIFY
jgi:cytochrome c oxidase subunit 2